MTVDRKKNDETNKYVSVFFSIAVHDFWTTLGNDIMIVIEVQATVHLFIHSYIARHLSWPILRYG